MDYVVQQPAHFQAAEIRAQRQPSRLTKTILPSARGKTRRLLRHSGILPDDRVGDRLPGFLVPNYAGFPLVGDPHGGEFAGGNSAASQGFCRNLIGVLNNLGGIMLHPTRIRIDLLVFFLRNADHAAIGVEYHESRAGRPRIDCCDIPFHFFASLRPNSFRNAAIFVVYSETAEALRPGSQRFSCASSSATRGAASIASFQPCNCTPVRRAKRSSMVSAISYRMQKMISASITGKPAAMRRFQAGFSLSSCKTFSAVVPNFPARCLATSAGREYSFSMSLEKPLS